MLAEGFRGQDIVALLCSPRCQAGNEGLQVRHEALLERHGAMGRVAATVIANYFGMRVSVRQTSLMAFQQGCSKPWVGLDNLDGA
jgi:hypothetical protein